MSNRGNNWTMDELKILIQLWTESSIMEIFDRQKNGKTYKKLAQQLMMMMMMISKFNGT